MSGACETSRDADSDQEPGGKQTSWRVCYAEEYRARCGYKEERCLHCGWAKAIQAYPDGNLHGCKAQKVGSRQGAELARI